MGQSVGLENTLTIPIDKARTEWSVLIKKIKLKKGQFYIRNYGRNGNRNEILVKLYKEIFGIEIKFDPTNNNKPTKLIQDLIGKKEKIVNYQVCHVFGRTKNVFCFTAPWNIVFIPKILDPFTGHEAKGPYVKHFQECFQKKVYKIFKKEIKMYNDIMEKYNEPILDWIEKNVDSKIKKEPIKNIFKKIWIP